ncbi:hypothetical protein HK098_004740 [Nowakowskiella sp. JEL0407]|nr:hypothetical protein HK098_004740 [Nowakowskiella sp. JEL0407]
MLTNSENSKIDSALSDGEVLATSVARLYRAFPNPKEWSYENTVGGVALFRKRKDYWIKIVDISGNAGVLWECELKSGLDKYFEDLPFFHSFMGPGYLVGLSFADGADASTFHKKVTQRESISSTQSNQAQERPSIVVAPAKVVSAPPSPITPNANIIKSPSTEKVSKPSKAGGVSLFGNKGKNAVGPSKKKIDKSMISAPSDFQHISHVGFNAKTGFSSTNLPEGWKEIFAKAGISEESMNDKATRKVVKKFMKEHVLGSGKPSNDAPPPPRESTARRAPPPPPPSRSNRGPPPPPPPSRPSVSKPVDSEPMPVKQPPPPPARDSKAPPQPAPRPPPIPARDIPPTSTPAPPPVPSRNVPPPPPISGLSQPPPPPPISGLPPPPPPSTGLQIPSSSTPRVSSTGDEGRGSLLDSIRGFGGAQALRKASERQLEPVSPVNKPEEIDNLADLLKGALDRRKMGVNDSDSEDDEDDEDW